MTRADEAIALHQLGQHQAVLRVLDAAHAEAPTDAELWYLRGRLLDDQGRPGLACGAYRRAIELDPDHRLAWDNLAFLLDNDLVLPAFRDAYARTAELVIQRIEPLWSGVDMQRIHGDCHLGNILWMDQGPTFLDFDDMVIGPVMQDLWLMFGGRDAWGERRKELVLEGYDSYQPFPREQLRLVEPLRTLRYIHFTAWLARRHEDPAFQVAFPHYGSESYWSRCIADLREQMGLIPAVG